MEVLDPFFVALGINLAASTCDDCIKSVSDNPMVNGRIEAGNKYQKGESHVM
jgi:hypothetical protein